MIMQCPNCHQSMTLTAEHFSIDVECPNCTEVVGVPDGPLGKGMVLGDFVIDTEIGLGGMATVFLARQISLEREVALKILHPDLARNTEQVEGFVREARIAAKLNHPGIVQIYSVGEAEGYYYFAMELVMGASVKEILDGDSKPELDWSLMVARKITIALDHAWKEVQLVHRDIKPDNIIIRADGAVKLADLGLAKPASALIESGELIEGSPHYISPEAVKGDPLDFRSDVYGLGATLYHMVTGDFPFVGDTAITTARMHMEAELELPDIRSPDVPANVSRIIAKMMKKDPDDRHQSLRELADDLKSARRKTSVHTQVLLPDRSKKNKLPIYLLGAAVVLILFIITLFMLNNLANKNPPSKGPRQIIIRSPKKPDKKTPDDPDKTPDKVPDTKTPDKIPKAPVVKNFEKLTFTRKDERIKELSIIKAKKVKKISAHCINKDRIVIHFPDKVSRASGMDKANYIMEAPVKVELITMIRSKVVILKCSGLKAGTQQKIDIKNIQRMNGRVVGAVSLSFPVESGRNGLNAMYYPNQEFAGGPK
ncbi:MAG: serine/threonine protein kinase, partial [Lentisphaeria bacterium]|nr:serine/threonine protein kinase [Lentisphaeria bacterium]NQZ68940.1 serine/threonine protein kinase [Lentisphaeria bacterium]